MQRWTGPLKKIDEYRYEIPKDYKPGMRTSGIIYMDAKMLDLVTRDNALEQVANVATLPGIVGKSLAMPDIHWGYGFPIGGVAATDAEEGVLSPGGVGFDINCGVRLIRTNLSSKDITSKTKELIDTMFINIPSGLGSKGKIRVTHEELKNVLEQGVPWAVEKGYGWEEDLEYLEENGHMDIADATKVSERAIQRGMPQLGSLGAGNHFLEIQKVDKIYDERTAKVLGIEHEGQITVMIHTGSRGCGHQIASDYIKEMERAVKKYNIILPDRQLACAPTTSKESQDYFKAMACAANFGWTNRQLILHWVRESFEKVLKHSAEDLGMHLVYGITHNMAKLEEHEVDGKKRKLYVHRKGATRTFAEGSADIPRKYSSIGQPVLIPGDMGTASYVLVGTKKAMEETFGSTCHGAGRVMSRRAATRRFNAASIKESLRQKGIYVRAASRDVLTEEAPESYKRIDDVVGITHGAGISRRIARLVPLGVMKG